MKKREDYDVGQGSGWVKKCFLKMKLLVFSVVFLGLTTVSAETYSQEVFSLRVKNKTLAEVFKEISRVTDYEFMYSGTELQLVFPVTKLVNLVTELGSKVSSLATVTTLLRKYENVYLGFAFTK